MSAPSIKPTEESFGVTIFLERRNIKNTARVIIRVEITDYLWGKISVKENMSARITTEKRERFGITVSVIF
ncbi:MAG: hypothetical protein LBU65_16015 [Planctomycetaceae bacterium]|jgi:hypothetical protein|nr:hypothetical protein [Planctomycetaceae bacterium]